MFAEDNSNDKTGTSDDSNKGIDIEKKFELKLLGDHSFKFKAPADNYNTDPVSFTGNLAPKFKNNFGIEFISPYVKLVSHWQIDILVTNSQNIKEIILAQPQENYISVMQCMEI